MSTSRRRVDWFKATILPHEAALFQRLRRMLPSGHDIQDLVAEALARAYAGPGWENVTAGRAYLFQIARHLVVDAARRDNVVSFDLMADLDLLQVDNTFEAGILARDELRHIQAITEELPPQCRRVFILRRVYDFSTTEIAEQLGISVSTVEKHLTKAVLRVMQATAELEGNDLGRQAAQPRRATRDRRGSGTPRR